MDLKRAFDISASAIGIAFLSPVFAGIATVGALHFRSNPFHLVDRAGKGAEPFRMIKFRSLLDERDASGALLDESRRKTGFGRFLRGTALDELPQLINILKGDMSFVGPRPHLIDATGTELLPLEYSDILRVRPGLTGPWQVAAIGTKTTPQDRLEAETRYVRSNPSLAKDMKLMIKTIPAFFKGHDGETIHVTPGESAKSDNSGPKPR